MNKLTKELLKNPKNFEKREDYYIEDPCCSFDLSVLLREVGFNSYCQKYYSISLKSKKDDQDGYSGSFGWRKHELSLHDGFNNNDTRKPNQYWYACSAPKYNVVIDWLEEFYKIYFVPFIDINNDMIYSYKIYDNDKCLVNGNFYNTRKEAMEDGLTYVLTNIQLNESK
jgi:hypothetical protein